MMCDSQTVDIVPLIPAVLSPSFALSLPPRSFSPLQRVSFASTHHHHLSSEQSWDLTLLCQHCCSHLSSSDPAIKDDLCLPLTRTQTGCSRKVHLGDVLRRRPRLSQAAPAQPTRHGPRLRCVGLCEEARSQNKDNQPPFRTLCTRTALDFAAWLARATHTAC